MFQFILVFIHGLLPMYYDCGYPKIMPTVRIVVIETFCLTDNFIFRSSWEMRQYFSSFLPTFISSPMSTTRKRRKKWRRRHSRSKMSLFTRRPYILFKYFFNTSSLYCLYPINNKHKTNEECFSVYFSVLYLLLCIFLLYTIQYCL